MTIARGSRVIHSTRHSQLVLTWLPQLVSFRPLLARSHEYPRNWRLSIGLVLARESALAPTSAGIPSRRAGTQAWAMPPALASGKAIHVDTDERVLTLGNKDWQMNRVRGQTPSSEEPLRSAGLWVPVSAARHAPIGSPRQRALETALNSIAVVPRFSDLFGRRPTLGELLEIVRRFNCLEWLSYLSRVSTTLGPLYELNPDRQAAVFYGIIGSKVRAAIENLAKRDGRATPRRARERS